MEKISERVVLWFMKHDKFSKKKGDAFAEAVHGHFVKIASMTGRLKEVTVDLIKEVLRSKVGLLPWYPKPHKAVAVAAAPTAGAASSSSNKPMPVAKPEPLATGAVADDGSNDSAEDKTTKKLEKKHKKDKTDKKEKKADKKSKKDKKDAKKHKKEEEEAMDAGIAAEAAKDVPLKYSHLEGEIS